MSTRKKREQTPYRVVQNYVPEGTAGTKMPVGTSRPGPHGAPYRISRVSIVPTRTQYNNSWRPSYFKPNASLVRTLSTMRGKLDDYSYSTFLGQILESRYRVYQDQMDRRYATQRDAYEQALDLASINAKEGKDVEVPDMPRVQGLAPGQGIQGLYKAMEKSLADTSDPKQIKTISRFYRYEIDRLQSIEGNIREQQNSLADRKQAFMEDIEKAIARGDVKKSQFKTRADIEKKAEELAKKEQEKEDKTKVKDKEPSGYAAGDSGMSTSNRIGPSGYPIVPESRGNTDSSVARFLGKIGGESEDALFWTIDKLSRPIYGVSNVAKDFYASDEDGNDHNGVADFFGRSAGGAMFGPLGFVASHAFGGNPFESYDEFVEHPLAETWGSAKAFGRGFSGEDKTTFRDVIRYNAQHDDVKNMRDSTRYQAWVGLGADLVYDPLNYVGIGIAKKPIDAIRVGKASSKAAKAESAVRKTSEDVAKIVSNSQYATTPAGHLSDPENVYKLLTGDSNKLPHTTGDRTRNIHEINANVRYLENIINQADINPDVTSLRDIEALGRALTIRRQALVDEYGDSILTQSLTDTLENSVQSGKMTQDDLEEFQDILDSVQSEEIVPLLTPANEYQRYLNRRAAEEFNVGESRVYHEGAGYAEDFDSVRTGADNLDQWEGINRTGVTEGQDSAFDVGINASPERRARSVYLYGKTGDTKGRLTKSEWEQAAENPANADRMTEILAEAPGRALADALPSRLKNDPRLADFDWEHARRVAYAKTAKTAKGSRAIAISTRLNGEIASKRKAIETASSKGNSSLVDRLSRELNGLETRRDILVSQRDHVQAATIIKLAKAHVASKPEFNEAGEMIKPAMRTFINPDSARKLNDELEEVNRLLAGHSKDDLSNVKDTPADPRRAVGRDRYDTDEVSFLDRKEMPGPPKEGIKKPTDIVGKGGKGTAPDLSRFAGPDDAAKVTDDIAPSGRASSDKKYAEGSDIYQMNEAALKGRRRELEQQLRDLEGVSAESGKRFPLQEAPEAFVTADGKLDTKALSQVIRFDKDKKMFVIKPGHTSSKWLVGYKNVLQDIYERHFENLRTSGDMRRLSHHVKESKKHGQKLPQKFWDQYNAAIAKASREAQSKAIKETEDAFEANRLYETVYSESLDLMLPKVSAEESLIAQTKAKQAAEKATLQEEKRIADAQGAAEEVERINAELGALRQKHADERIAIEVAVKEMRLAKVEMHKRMREEALFRAASLAVSPYRKQFAIKMVGGGMLRLPGSGLMFKAAEDLNSMKFMQGTRQFFADSFRSPASRLSPEGQLIRARAVAMTPNIIEHHINRLRATVGDIPIKDRKFVFNRIINHDYAPKPGVDVKYDAIRGAFDDLLPFFRNEVPVGDGPLTKSDINRYLPEEYRVAPNAKIGSTQDLIKAMRKGDSKAYKDPYQISWALRVAVEQAQARRALEYTIGKFMGLKRGGVINPKTGKVSKASIKGDDRKYYQAVEGFGKLGWETIPELGNKHYFPPEVVPDITALLKMMEPRNISQVGALVDRATHGWKTMTTIYNPGYWTRNGIGEVMSSFFAGVNDPRAYDRAWDIIKYARGDGRELEDLTKHLPGLSSNVRPVSGDKILFTTAGGTKVSVADIWLAYNHQGLKTGFVNTEFDANFSKLGAAVRSGGGQKVVNFNDKLRGAGEWYEDGLRVAHFADAIKRHSGSFEEAINSAAAEVRKYHFDYTDFTDFEKMAMLRVFPFYKWTRKALPLMITMLFTKPGKVMAYPKIMNTISTQDIVRDDNGYAPDYTGIIPGWMQDMWAYKIAEGSDEEHEESFFNLATPQMDIYKSIVNPGSTGYGLLNPLIKVPVEQVQGFFGSEDSGNTLATVMGKADLTNNTNMSVPLNTNDDRETTLRLNQLMRQVPVTNYLQKLGLGSGKLNDGDWQDTASFLTGLGFYKNDDKRRLGELMNQGFTRKEATKKLRDLYAE